MAVTLIVTIDGEDEVNAGHAAAVLQAAIDRDPRCPPATVTIPSNYTVTFLCGTTREYRAADETDAREQASGPSAHIASITRNPRG